MNRWLVKRLGRNWWVARTAEMERWKFCETHAEAINHATEQATQDLARRCDHEVTC